MAKKKNEEIITKKQKRNTFLNIILFLLAFLLLGQIFTEYVEGTRDHSSGVGVIFSPCPGTTSFLTEVFGTAFALFSTLSFTILFYLHEKKREGFCYILIGFSFLLAGFFFSLGNIILARSGGYSISLDFVYWLIKFLIMGIGLSIVSLFK